MNQSNFAIEGDHIGVTKMLLELIKSQEASLLLLKKEIELLRIRVAAIETVPK